LPDCGDEEAEGKEQCFDLQWCASFAVHTGVIFSLIPFKQSIKTLIIGNP